MSDKTAPALHTANMQQSITTERKPAREREQETGRKGRVGECLWRTGGKKVSQTERHRKKRCIYTEDHGKINLKRWWEQLGYLTIESGLPGFFSFSFPSLGCLSSAQSGSHLTARTHTPTHSLSHTHSRRSATVPMPKHPPHGHIQSPSSSCPLLLFCLSFSFALSVLLRVARADSHGHSHEHSPRAQTRTVTPVHAQTDGEMVRGDFAGCWRE